MSLIFLFILHRIKKRRSKSGLLEMPCPHSCGEAVGDKLLVHNHNATKHGKYTKHPTNARKQDEIYSAVDVEYSSIDDVISNRPPLPPNRPTSPPGSPQPRDVDQYIEPINAAVPCQAVPPFASGQKPIQERDKSSPDDEFDLGTYGNTTDLGRVQLSTLMVNVAKGDVSKHPILEHRNMIRENSYQDMPHMPSNHLDVTSCINEHE